MDEEFLNEEIVDSGESVGVGEEAAENLDLFEVLGVESKEQAPQRMLAKDFILKVVGSDFPDEFEGLEDDDEAYEAKFHEIVTRLGKGGAIESEISTLKAKIRGLEDNDPGEIYRIAALEYTEEQVARGERRPTKEEVEAILLNDEGELTQRAIRIASKAQGKYESKLERLENDKKDFMKQAAEAPKRYQQEIKAKVSTYKNELAKHVEEYGVAGMPVKKENISQLERSLFVEAQKMAFSPSESQLFKTIKNNPAAMLEIVVKYSNDPLAVKIRERMDKKNDIDAQTKVVKKLNKSLPDMAVRTAPRKAENIFALIEQ